MSAAGLIKRFGQKITVKRDTNVESFSYGKRVDDVYSSFEITASVQPMRPDEVVDEAVGGERNRHSVRVYSSVLLKAVDDRQGYKADIITYRGEDFEVVGVDDWTENKRGLQHYRAIAQRIEPKEAK